MARERLQPLLLALGLCLAVFALYWPVRGHDWVSYDDPVYLLENPHVKKGLDPGEVAWVFTHDHAANYHPLTWVSHMLDVELFGLEPGPHHLVNVALHALNAALVLFLCRALLGSLWAGALAAGLFALHPLRVESVAWASERKDVLCALFFLAACLAYLRHGRRPSPGRFALVCLLLVLALLSKPMAVTFPCVALLFDVWPLGRLRIPGGPGVTSAEHPRKVWLEKAPLFALAFLGALSTWIAQVVGGAAAGLRSIPLDLRLWNSLAAYGAYLRETFWPADLAVFHPLAAIVSDDPRAALLLPAGLATLVLLVVSVLAWRTRASRPWFALGWCWFLGTLVPAIGLKQVGSQAHADRYTYLPLIGVAWIVAGFALELTRRRRGLRLPVAALAGLALVALTLTARTQVHTWKDTSTLFTHALAVTERNHVAHAALGTAYLEDGEPEAARRELAAALEIHPLDVNALTTLGRLEREAGNLEEAELALRRAKGIQASKWVRYQLGCLRLAQGAPERALQEFKAALELDPSLVDARFNLGQILHGLGRKEEAAQHFRFLIELVPNYAGGYNGLGVWMLESDPVEAERLFRRAVELDPDYAGAVNNLGVALERQGRTQAAREQYDKARRLRASPPE